MSFVCCFFKEKEEKGSGAGVLRRTQEKPGEGKHHQSILYIKVQLFFKIKVHRLQCINPFKHACITGLHLKQKYLLIFYRCHVIDTSKHISAKNIFLSTNYQLSTFMLDSRH